MERPLERIRTPRSSAPSTRPSKRCGRPGPIILTNGGRPDPGPRRSIEQDLRAGRQVGDRHARPRWRGRADGRHLPRGHASNAGSSSPTRSTANGIRRTPIRCRSSAISTSPISATARPAIAPDRATGPGRRWSSSDKDGPRRLGHLRRPVRGRRERVAQEGAA